MPSTQRFHGRVAAMGACVLAAFTSSAQARTAYRVLRSFHSTDGANPVADLTFDSAGDIYGTTQLGGSHNLGTVFKIAPNGKETVLHSFTGGKDGSYPSGGVAIISETGDLYGSTKDGGKKKFGTIWHILPDGTFVTVLNFNFKNGAYGVGRLIQDDQGTLYGVTQDGGKGGFGTVYALSLQGNYRILYSFTGHEDGAVPSGALIRDQAGDLYGTTQGGGTNDEGAVFVVSATGHERVLYSFTGGNDGSTPVGQLIRDASGLLYGTTYTGGKNGYGTVFSVGTDGSFFTLHAFAKGNDGAYPQGNLLEIGNTLYGTTVHGGGSCDCGTVYDVTTGGDEKILHSFAGPLADGETPYAGLVGGPDQLLYGVTESGGVDDDGTVFRIGQ